MEPARSIADLSDVARCLIADSDLWATSRFERLHLINLLSIQRRLSLLETKIDQYVRYEQSLKGDQPREEPPETPEQVLAELHATLKQYGEAVSFLATLKQTKAPASHIITALRRTVPQFSSFYQGLDLTQSAKVVAPQHFSVGAEPQSWLYQYIARHEHLARIFQQGHTLQGVDYTKFSGNLLVKAEFGLIAICLCLVQLLPVLALTLVSSKAARLGIIICLIVLVSVLNALFANTVRATNFGAIAAYSAIVVVFISQSNSP